MTVSRLLKSWATSAGQLADRFHLLRLPKLLLHLGARRDVADEAGIDAGRAEQDFADRQLHRKDGAVLALRLDLASDADDPLLAGAPIAGKVAVMLAAMRLRA